MPDIVNEQQIPVSVKEEAIEEIAGKPYIATTLETKQATSSKVIDFQIMMLRKKRDEIDKMILDKETQKVAVETIEAKNAVIEPIKEPILPIK